MEDRRVERMRSLAPPCHPQPQPPLLCHPKAPYFVIPTPLTLSSRGSARDLGLTPSRRSLLPPPVTSSCPTPIGNPSPRWAAHPVADPLRRKPSRRFKRMPSSAPMSSRRPLPCHPEALYFVIPRPLTLSSRGSARDLGLSSPFTSVSTSPPHPRPIRRFAKALEGWGLS